MLKTSVKYLFILLISIFFLEFLLRSTGFLFDFSKEDYSIYKDKKVILCAGDSFTYGLGVPSGHDYPSVLEKLIGREDTKALNTGMPGANTYIISEKIRDVCEHINPDYVILMAGANDYWNFDSGEKDTSVDFFNNLSILRLYRLLKSSISERLSFLSVSGGKIYALELEYNDHYPVSRSFSDTERFNKAVSAKKNGDIRKSYNIMKKLVQENPDNMEYRVFHSFLITQIDNPDVSDSDFVKTTIEDMEKSGNIDFEQKAYLMFRYAGMNKGTSEGMRYLLKACSILNENHDILINIPVYLASEQIIREYGDYAFDILSEGVKDNIIKFDILKDAGMIIKKITYLSPMKNRFDMEFYKYEKNDGEVNRDISEFFLKYAEKDKDILKKGIKWHEKNFSGNSEDYFKYNIAILYDMAGKHAEAIKIVRELSENNNENADYLLFLINLSLKHLSNQNDIYSLLEKTGKLIEEKNIQDIFHISRYHVLSSRYDRRNLDRAIEWHEDILKVKDYPELLFNLGYLYFLKGKNNDFREKSIHNIRKSIALSPENRKYSDFLEIVLCDEIKQNQDKNRIYGETIENIEKIINFLKKKNINIILLNYPDNYLPGLKELSEKYQCSFIDINKLFLEAADRERFFLPDLHLSIEGNRFLAEIIYQKFFR